METYLLVCVWVESNLAFKTSLEEWKQARILSRVVDCATFKTSLEEWKLRVRIKERPILKLLKLP